MPLATIDLLADIGVFTVTSGGTTAPVAGTTETWTVTPTTGAPAASNASNPPTQFRVVDEADTHVPPEIITVTNVAGGSWSVTRSAEGAAPWAHAAGWTAVVVLSAAGLGNAIPAKFNSVGDAILTGESKVSLIPAGNSALAAVLDTSGNFTSAVDLIATAAVRANKSGTVGRYVGQLTGAPTTGSYTKGDFGNDPTNNVIWQCSAAGTPGTWVSIGVVGAVSGTYNLNSQYNGKCDGVVVTDFGTTNASATVTSSKITAASNGKTVMIDAAGAAGAVLVATLSGCTTGSGTMSVTASVTLSNAKGFLGTDDTTAWNNMMAAWYSGDGGEMRFQGISLVTGVLTLPNDGHTYTPVNGAGPPNTPQVVGPWQPNGRIRGFGEYWDGQWGGTLTGDPASPHQPGGSILVTSATTAPAAIVTEGTGALEIDHLTITMMTPDAVYGVLTTNTTVHAHHGATTGRPTKLKNGAVAGTTACSQTAFKFGGTTTTVGLGTSAAFQGYGSSVKDWYFDRICHVVVDGDYGNGIALSSITVSLTCGSGTSADAPVVYSNGTGAHSFTPFTPELGGYPNGYAVKLASGNTNCLLLGVGSVDASNGVSGAVYCGPGSVNNYILAAYRDSTATPIVVEDSSVATKNRIDSMFDYDKGYLDMNLSANQAITSAGGTVIWNNYKGGSAADSDPGGLMNTSTGTITIKTPGLYSISWQICFLNGGSNAQVSSQLSVNGTGQNIGGRFDGSSAQAVASGSCCLRLAAGTTVTIGAFAFAGAETLLAANTILTMARVA